MNKNDDDILMMEQDDVMTTEPEKSKVESTHSDSTIKTPDNSVIELGEADSSITMLLHRKKTHHQSSTSPCTLDFSNLRVSDDHDKSIVSEGNLSDVCPIDEFDENSARPAEKILEQLTTTGNPAELSLDDPDLEHLLDDSTASNPTTSTPAASPSREDDNSESDSIPSLVYSTPSTADSGNSSKESSMSSESDANAGSEPQSDAVKTNFEKGHLLIKSNFSNHFMPRLLMSKSEPQFQGAIRSSPPVAGMDNDILNFITYIFISSFLNMYCYSRASELTVYQFF